MITLEEYFKDRDKAYASELTDEIRRNAKELLLCVNALLLHMGMEHAEVSSGWRPAEVNKRVGGARKSKHVIGKAIDLVDHDRQIASKLTVELLDEVGLWAEDPSHTATWVHLQSEPPKSGRRIFKP